jgi:MFS family permease
MSNQSLSPVDNDPLEGDLMHLEEQKNESFIRSITRKYKQLKVGDLLILSGHEHFYQYFALIAMFLIGVIEGTYKFIIPYIFYNVKFECMNSEGIYQSCSSKIACSGTQKFKVTSEIFSMNKNFELYCENHIYEMYSSFIIVAGGGLIAFFLFFIADYFGRKACFYSGLFIHIVTTCIIYVARSSLIITVISLTLNMGAVFLWYSNVTVFLNESLGGITRLISMPLIICSRSFGIMFNVVVFYFLPDYIYGFAVLLVILSAFAPCYLFIHETLFYQYQKSSLGNVYATAKKICNINFEGSEKDQRKSYIYKMLFRFDHSQDPIMEILENKKDLPIDASRISNARLVLLEKQLMSSMSSISINYSQTDQKASELVQTRLKNMMGKSISNEDVEKLLSPELVSKIKKISMTDITKNEQNMIEGETQKSKNYGDLFKMKYFFKLIGATVICVTILTANGLTAFSIQSIGFSSIYVSGIWIGIFDLIGGLSSVLFASKVSTKFMLIISQMIFFIASLQLLLSFYFEKQIIEDLISKDSLVNIEILSSIICRFAVSFSQGIAYTYCTELFPTHIRAMAFGIIFTFSRLGMATSEVFIFYLNDYGINPNAAIFFFAFFALPISLFMPRTSVKMSN